MSSGDPTPHGADPWEHDHPVQRGQNRGGTGGRMELMGVGSGFVGRVTELQTLRECLADVRSGRPRVVVVEGAPGSGKSTLLAEFVAGLADAVVLRVEGDEDEILLAYGVVDQLQAGGVTGPRSDPLAVGALLLDRFDRLQEDGQIPVVVIDDLQWVDRPSLRALLFAVRRLRADRVLVVMSVRLHELTDPGWARFVAGDARVTRVRLGGLTTAGVIALARALGLGVLSGRGAARLVAHTDGNALYCRALLEEIGVAELNRPGSDGLPVPRELSAVILARVGALSPAAQALLAAAAVLGPHASVASTAAVAGLADAGAEIDAAARAGLLAEGSDPSRVGFTHPLYRAAVYGDLDPGARRRLHGLAATHVTGRPGLVHRVAATVGADDGLAMALETFSRAAAGAGDAPAVAWALEQAGTFSTEPADRERRLLDAAVVLLNAADTPAAERVLSLVDGSSARKDALLGLLGVYTASPTTERRLRAAWDTHHRVAEREVGARAATSLTNWLLVSGRAVDALRWADRAVGATDRGSALWVMASTALAYALASAGRSDHALSVLRFLDPAADQVPIPVTDALIMRGMVRVCADDLAGAVADLGVAVARMRAGVPSSYPGPCLAYLSDAHYRRGRWDAAVAAAEVATATADDSGRPLDLARGHAQAAYVPAARGQWAVAADHVATARAAAEQSPLAFAVVSAAGAGAATAFAHADLPGVLLAIEPVHALGSAAAGGYPGMFNWRAFEADALIGLGHLTEARTALAAFAAAMPQAGLASAAMALARCHGNLALANEDEAGSRSAFAEAYRISPHVPMPFEQALLDLDDGRRLAANADRGSAVARLDSAHRVFSALGADPYVQTCARELATLQVAATSTSPATLLGLSPAELAVARLAAAGRTNREVAGDLYLSMKTVEYHLHNIFLKLDITSRRALPASLR